MPKPTPTEYIEELQPKGYINNRDITNLDGQYLVKGSKNTIIKRQEKVASRKGYTLVGDAKTINKPTLGSYDWYTSSGLWRNVKSYDDELEVWYNGDWIRIKNGFADSDFQFTPWWDPDELIDVLLMVNGDDYIREWSGGIAEVASVTSNTITKKGYLADTSIAFNDNGASADTLTDSNNGFVTAGFASGDEIIITGSTSNDGRYTIDTVTAGVITLIEDDTLTTEAAGDSVVIKWKNNGTWAEARFFTADTRKVVIDGEEYTYTGGENTGTLTGVTPNPSTGGVVAGDLALQAIREYQPAILDGFTNDLIGVFNNHVIIASNSSRIVYIADSSDFTDFGYTSPLRVPGEGFELTLDSTPTAIVPDENTLKISAGRDDWYEIEMVLSADQSGESITVRKLKTATGQAARSQGAVVYIKNNAAFLSFEPTIDTLGSVENIEGPEATPISDDIKNDLDSYDLTNAHGIYADRSLFMALPNEGILLIYDLQDRFWQPPQTIPVQRLALIDIEGDGVVRLCGHSSVGNETYRLFYGYNDNGISFTANATFGYENFNTRFSKKQFDEVATEINMSESTIVTEKVEYDYKGSTGVREFTLDGSSNTGRFAPASGGGFGKDHLGSAPFGSLSTSEDGLNRYKRIHETPLLDFYEKRRIFESDSEDVRFEILAYGENAVLSENLPTELKES